MPSPIPRQRTEGWAALQLAVLMAQQDDMSQPQYKGTAFVVYLTLPALLPAMLFLAVCPAPPAMKSPTALSEVLVLRS